MNIKGRRGVIPAALLALALGGCGDILEVTDPQRYTSEDLDTALPAVANGVEGAFHEVMDTYVIYQELLSDTYQHTGTWQGYDETDHGRFQYGTSQMDGTHAAWLRARWFAGDAEERFNRVLGESEAASDPLMAQVHLASGLTDLYIGMAVCESPAVASGPAVSDVAILQQAEEKLTRAIQTAGAANRQDYARAATAGRAQARLLLGNTAGAASDAASIPANFSYEAQFNIQNTNSIVQLTTVTYNQAAGLREKWWGLIDPSESGNYMRDPHTNEPDPRIEVFHIAGDIATDNLTPHYSQWKYDLETSNIPIMHSDLMRLIEAEVLGLGGNYAGAMGIINTLRANVGLSALPVPGDQATFMEYLLSERFAETFMEGMRMVDLYRFDLVDDIFGAMADNERPVAGRPIKFSMDDQEAQLNPEIADDLAQRCLPTS